MSIRCVRGFLVRLRSSLVRGLIDFPISLSKNVMIWQLRPARRALSSKSWCCALPRPKTASYKTKTLAGTSAKSLLAIWPITISSLLLILLPAAKTPLTSRWLVSGLSIQTVTGSGLMVSARSKRWTPISKTSFRLSPNIGCSRLVSR